LLTGMVDVIQNMGLRWSGKDVHDRPEYVLVEPGGDIGVTSWRVTE